MIAAPEMLILLAVGVLIFGASKIPKLARALGRSEGEFKAGLEESEEMGEEVST